MQFRFLTWQNSLDLQIWESLGKLKNEMSICERHFIWKGFTLKYVGLPIYCSSHWGRILKLIKIFKLYLQILSGKFVESNKFCTYFKVKGQTLFNTQEPKFAKLYWIVITCIFLNQISDSINSVHRSEFWNIRFRTKVNIVESIGSVIIEISNVFVNKAFIATSKNWDLKRF